MREKLAVTGDLLAIGNCGKNVKAAVIVVENAGLHSN